MPPGETDYAMRHFSIDHDRAKILPLLRQALQVDLGRLQHVRRVVLDTGADAGDFPRGYVLLASNDGERWREVARGPGSGQLTTIDIRRTPRATCAWSRPATMGAGGRWRICASTADA